jgi:hypothetical protein
MSVAQRTRKAQGMKRSIYLGASQELLAQPLLGSVLYHMSPNTARLCAVFERRGSQCELEK